MRIVKDLGFDRDPYMRVRRHWTFDEFYSQFATRRVDKNNDGVLDRDELKEPAEGALTL